VDVFEMRILLTNRELVNIGGSELVTVELAEEFTRQGHEVVVYSPRVGGVLDTSHLNVSVDRPRTDDFDLLWIHHNLLIHDLGFRKRAGQRIIFNHMSSYVPDEWPRLAGYEMAIADVVLCNSEETRVVLEGRGLSGVKLFQNPAPIGFEGAGGRGGGRLLVSNHPPAEILSIPGCRFGGPNGGRTQHRIGPYQMADAHTVVCNGKTVAYALRAGVPVYLYDHFGGPGWLTSENFERAEYFNFSGRGFGRKTYEEIFTELRTVPEPMSCPDRFKLEKCLEVLGL
jgi:glycosyltransferase involved in cell wall biosynthesis